MQMQTISLLEEFNAFMEAGGVVLSVLFFVSLLFWTLLFERFIYHRTIYKPEAKKLKKKYKPFRTSKDWGLLQYKNAEFSSLSSTLQNGLTSLKMLILLFPLLGLLGTITGMISVFDTMGALGTNAKAMASGISMATIPTMAGMVLAVLGLFAYSRIHALVVKDVRLLKDSLLKDDDA